MGNPARRSAVRVGLRGIGMSLSALSGWAALACTTPAGGGPPPAPAPIYVRAHGVFTEEERNHDVVRCAEQARQALVAEPASARRSAAALRTALHDGTSACMVERGWRPSGPPPTR